MDPLLHVDWMVSVLCRFVEGIIAFYLSSSHIAMRECGYAHPAMRECGYAHPAMRECGYAHPAMRECGYAHPVSSGSGSCDYSIQEGLLLLLL